MISSINPIGPSTPSGNSPDATSIAKSFGTELDSLTALLSHVELTTLEAQMSNIAQRISAVSEQAQKALSVGKG